MTWTKIGAIEPADEDLNIMAKVYLSLCRLYQLSLWEIE